MGRMYIFVGPDPNNAIGHHPGGQLTAAKGLMQYAEENNIQFKIVDTLQSSFPVPSFKERFYKYSMRMISLIKFLQTMQIDGIIIFSSSGFSFIEKSILILICRIFNKPSILFLRSGHFFEGLNGSMKNIYKIFLKIPTVIAVQGLQWKRSLEKINVPTKKIRIIPNWVSDKSILQNHNTIGKNGRTNIQPIFVYLGWLVKEKGLVDLFNVYRDSTLLKKCKLVIMGDGHLYEKLKVYINRYGLSNIEMMGWCSSDKVNTVLSQADVFVLPSYAEGFPNAIVEALSFGLPVISTNVGGIPDSVIHGVNGFIIKPGNRSQLKKSMEKFVLNRNLINKFSKKSIEILLNRHTQKNNCLKLLKTLDSEYY